MSSLVNLLAKPQLKHEPDDYPPKRLKLDESATTTSANLPACLSRPNGAAVYHGFNLVDETRTDGWCFGAITEFEDAEGCDWGDGFVVAPDGRRAGIVWEVGEGDIPLVAPPEESRWGVYAVWFPRMVRTVDDLVFNFRQVLPELKKRYQDVSQNK
jgi:hypothetical protein